MSARRPSAKFPNRCRAWYGASPTVAGCREFATRIGWPLHRSRGLPPQNLGDVAAVPARPGVAESHPPAPVPPASRFGWRRSGEPRAARPARRRSDDACSRAWPDQWDLDRSGHRRRPRGRNNCPRPPATNQSGRNASQSSSAKCIRSQTPARCQSRRRRQHVIPDPHPSSCGSICQGIPLRRTKTMPVRHARSETRGRPPCGRRARIGKKGSTRFHNRSGSNAAAIRRSRYFADEDQVR
jgi:hypothetical protein